MNNEQAYRILQRINECKGEFLNYLPEYTKFNNKAFQSAFEDSWEELSSVVGDFEDILDDIKSYVRRAGIEHNQYLQENQVGIEEI